MSGKKAFLGYFLEMGKIWVSQILGSFLHWAYQTYSADIDATKQDKRRIYIYCTQEAVIFISRPAAWIKNMKRMMPTAIIDSIRFRRDVLSTFFSILVHDFSKWNLKNKRCGRFFWSFLYKIHFWLMLPNFKILAFFWRQFYCIASKETFVYSNFFFCVTMDISSHHKDKMID